MGWILGGVIVMIIALFAWVLCAAASDMDDAKTEWVKEEEERRHEIHLR